MRRFQVSRLLSDEQYIRAHPALPHLIGILIKHVLEHRPQDPRYRNFSTRFQARSFFLREDLYGVVKADRVVTFFKKFAASIFSEGLFSRL